MLKMVNNVSLVGRLAAKPELKETADGVKVTSFVIVCDRARLNSKGEREADFIPVTAWRGTAEFICRNFDKGDYISVTGAIQTRIRTNNEGQNYKLIEVVADRCDFCGYRRPAKTEE